jgi:hypothetical protein
MGAETLDVVADRGYYAGKEILACEMVGITVRLPLAALRLRTNSNLVGACTGRFAAFSSSYGTD